jgi:hypothetical protein
LLRAAVAMILCVLVTGAMSVAIRHSNSDSLKNLRASFARALEKLVSSAFLFSTDIRRVFYFCVRQKRTQQWQMTNCRWPAASLALLQMEVRGIPGGVFPDWKCQGRSWISNLCRST